MPPRASSALEPVLAGDDATLAELHHRAPRPEQAPARRGVRVRVRRKVGVAGRTKFMLFQRARTRPPGL